MTVSLFGMDNALVIIILHKIISLKKYFSCQMHVLHIHVPKHAFLSTLNDE